jgi:hypothetical protein
MAHHDALKVTAGTVIVRPTRTIDALSSAGGAQSRAWTAAAGIFPTTASPVLQQFALTLKQKMSRDPEW